MCKCVVYTCDIHSSPLEEAGASSIALNKSSFLHADKMLIIFSFSGILNSLTFNRKF